MCLRGGSVVLNECEFGLCNCFHCTAQKMKFSILRISSVNVQNPQETADLVTFTEKSLMENFIFCVVLIVMIMQSIWKLFSCPNTDFVIDFSTKTPLFLVNPQSNPFELRSHLIHKFLCSYYLLGKTEIHIKVRSGEHSSASVAREKRPVLSSCRQTKIIAFNQVTWLVLPILFISVVSLSNSDINKYFVETF